MYLNYDILKCRYKRGSQNLPFANLWITSSLLQQAHEGSCSGVDGSSAAVKVD